MSLGKRRWVEAASWQANSPGCSREDSCSARFGLQVRLLFGDGGVPEELASAFWAEQRRASSRFRRRERIDHDVFDPIAVVTRTATVVVPLRWGVPRDLLQHLPQPVRSIRRQFVHGVDPPRRVGPL